MVAYTVIGKGNIVNTLSEFLRSYLIFIMLFLHIVDDYYLQGPLAEFKQKSWWEKNFPNELYKYDYIIALITHAFSWTFVVMLPTMILIEFPAYCFLFIINMILHAAIDDMKVNKKRISLMADQILHFIQIIQIVQFTFIHTGVLNG